MSFHAIRLTTTDQTGGLLSADGQGCTLADTRAGYRALMMMSGLQLLLFAMLYDMEEGT